MNSPLNLKVDRRLVLAGAVAVFLLAGFILVAMRNNNQALISSNIDNSQATGQPAVSEKRVDPGQLSYDYSTKSTKILADFFSAQQSGAEIGAVAKKAQADLLGLSLPGEYRQKHLNEVLKLGEIIDLVASGKTADLDKLVNELKTIASQ